MKDELATNHAKKIPESAYNKLLNSIAKIEIDDGHGTGFFLKLKKKE